MDARTRLLTVAALTVAVAAASSSGALAVLAAAPLLAVAFWRNALAAGLVWPLVVVRRRAELAAWGRAGRLRAVLAGVALAAHFGTWMPALALTSVATATALVCTQPVWAGLIAAARGHRLSRATWVGIAVAVTGAALATGADLTVSVEAVLGDLLALAGGVAGAVYVTLGEGARRSVSTTTYTAVCYGASAAVLLAAALAAGAPLAGYPVATWLAIAGLTVGPQLLGHSLVNFTLRRVSATLVSVVGLLEVPGSALLAWWWLGQTPAAATVPGMVLLTAGVALAVAGFGRTGAGRAGAGGAGASGPVGRASPVRSQPPGRAAPSRPPAPGRSA